jgi:adenosylhomocysteine nucleosidase
MDILITYALDEEKGAISLLGCNLHFCCTGIGKVQAGLAVQEALYTYRPAMVINIGSCGSLHKEVGTILVCSHFIDRDLKKVAIEGVCNEISFTDILLKKGLFPGVNLSHTVSTGDSFVTTEEEMGLHADVIDMEAFGIAMACKRYGVPLVSVKYVTDIIGENSLEHWEAKLSDAKIGLEAFLKDLIVSY